MDISLLSGINIKDQASFNRLESSLHYACQFIALTGLNVQVPLPDDYQNTMVYHEEKPLILGRIFSLSNKQYQIGVSLKPFELFLLDANGKTVSSFGLVGVAWHKVFQVWSSWLLELGYSGQVHGKMNYELPHYSESAVFETLTDDFVNNWHIIRSLANVVLSKLNKLADVESEINIWPHHFDTGVYYALQTISEEVTASIGAGLAIADKMINEPYYYLYGYTRDAAIDFNSVPDLTIGSWLTDDWKGAVLPISSLKNGNCEDQVNEFYKQSYCFIASQIV